MGILLANSVFNYYCSLVDLIGYNKITEAIRYLSGVIQYIYVILNILCLFIIDKLKNKYF